MIEAPFKTQDEMNSFLAKCKTVIESAPGESEKLRAVEQLVPQLRAGLDEIRRGLAEQARNVPITGGDAEVVRAYYSPDEGMVEKGTISDLRRKSAIDVSRGQTHIGSDGGVVRMFGSADETGVWEYGLADDPHPKSEWQKGLQDRLQAAAFLKAMQGPRGDYTKVFRAIQRHLARGPSQVAKVFADNAGEGGEFIVSIPLTQLERTAEMIRLIEAAIPTMTVSGGNTFTHPFLTSGVQAFLHGVPVAGDLNPAELPKSVPSTAERTINIKTLVMNVPIDMDAAEDSLIDAIGLLNDLVARAEVDATEDALINGDTAATHGDTAFATWNPRGRWQTLGSSVDHRRMCIGFRQRAFDVTSTVDLNATQTVSAYMGLRAGLTQPHGLGDLIYVTSPEHYLAKILLDTNLLTVDKYGSGATILTGEVGKIGGFPLLLSEFMTADLAATGLYTGSGALTSMLLINRSRFRIVKRRNFRINLTNEYTRHTSWVTASSRKALHTFDSSTTKNVRYAFNLSSS